MPRPRKKLLVSKRDRSHLESLIRAGNTPRKIADRARIVLWSSEGLTPEVVAERTGLTINAVYRWRKRYEDHGRDALADSPRSGRPRKMTSELAAEILRKTVHEIPHESTHWSLRLMARYTGTTVHQVREVWKAADLKPHRLRSFKISNDPDFAEKVQDVVGLYLDPPDHAMVLSVDEKTQIQALDRTQPLLPLRPGQVERRTHDYKRHGTRSLYAAFDIATGRVLGRVTKKHRAKEFLAFLRQLDRSVEPHLDLHLILDNSSTHGTPAVQAWLESHPRFHLHFTPTSASWLNAVETWFAQLTNRSLARGVFTSVEELRDEIHRFIHVHNQRLAKPFKWTKSAASIIAKNKKLRRTLSTDTFQTGH